MTTTETQDELGRLRALCSRLLNDNTIEHDVPQIVAGSYATLVITVDRLSEENARLREQIENIMAHAGLPEGATIPVRKQQGAE